MSEDLLYRPQVGPALQQVGGHRVAQAVRPQVGGVGHHRQGLVDQPTHHPGIDPCAAVTDEQGETRAGHGKEAAHPQPGVQCPKRRAAERHRPLLATLSEHAQEPALGVDVPEVEPAELGHPDPGRVEHLDDGQVAAPCGHPGGLSGLGDPCREPLQQEPGLVHLHRRRQPSVHLGRPQCLGRIGRHAAGALCPGEERPDCRRPALEGRPVGTTGMEIGQPGAQVGQRDVDQRAFAHLTPVHPREMGEQVRQVTGIRADGVHRQASLQPQVRGEVVQKRVLPGREEIGQQLHPASVVRRDRRSKLPRCGL